MYALLNGVVGDGKRIMRGLIVLMLRNLAFLKTLLTAYGNNKTKVIEN